MIRLVSALAIAALAAGCVAPRVIGAAPETPVWLGERISEAERSRRAYPSLADTPTWPADALTADEWDARIAEVVAKREALLNDPMLDDPDAAPGDKIDAATFSRETRAAMQREVDRQTPD